jgi:competence protein ComEC
MAASFGVWAGTQRPDVLVSDTGTLVGIMTPQGRALSKERGAGFVARNWLENDGDGGGQIAANARWRSGDVVHLSGKRALAAFTTCAQGQLVVSSVNFEDRKPSCLHHDPQSLLHTGAVAYRRTPTGLEVVNTAREVAGERLWTHWPEAKKMLRRGQKTAQHLSN